MEGERRERVPNAGQAGNRCITDDRERCKHDGKSIRNSNINPTLPYATEIKTRNVAQQSQQLYRREE